MSFSQGSLSLTVLTTPSTPNLSLPAPSVASSAPSIARFPPRNFQSGPSFDMPEVRSPNSGQRRDLIEVGSPQINAYITVSAAGIRRRVRVQYIHQEPVIIFVSITHLCGRDGWIWKSGKPLLSLN
jgi:hypothetical protein